ncbi:MAG: hypothetical protein KAI83_11185 [Thiomargarita sp.]|nr:hypothetical protein [Thiomargarita sp.]
MEYNALALLLSEYNALALSVRPKLKRFRGFSFFEKKTKTSNSYFNS